MNTQKTNRSVWNRVALIVTLIVMSGAMNGCGVLRGALRGVGARVLGNLGQGRIFNGPVANALRGNWNGDLTPRGTRQGGNQGGDQGGNQGGNQGGDQGGNQGGDQGGNQGGKQGGKQGGSETPPPAVPGTKDEQGNWNT